MEFKTTRASAIENLDNFIKNSLGEYSKLRNFDFGPDKRSNTCLLYTSPSPRDQEASRMPSSA